MKLGAILDFAFFFFLPYLNSHRILCSIYLSLTSRHFSPELLLQAPDESYSSFFLSFFSFSATVSKSPMWSCQTIPQKSSMAPQTCQGRVDTLSLRTQSLSWSGPLTPFLAFSPESLPHTLSSNQPEPLGSLKSNTRLHPLASVYAVSAFCNVSLVFKSSKSYSSYVSSQAWRTPESPPRPLNLSQRALFCARSHHSTTILQ